MKNAFINGILSSTIILLIGGCGKKNEVSPAKDVPPYAWVAIDASASMAGFFRAAEKSLSKEHSAIQRIMGTDELINLLNFPDPLTPFVTTVGETLSDAERVTSLSRWSRGTSRHLMENVY